MRFGLDELVALTGAKVLRWPLNDGVEPTHDMETAGPGHLYFPMGWILREGVLTQLAGAGVPAVVVCTAEGAPWLDRYPGLGVLAVANPPEAYFRLAQEARKHLQGPVVGVTGSSGKSTTREYLASILRQRYRVYTNPGNRNRWSDCAGVLLSMEGTADEAAVLEMGFGYPGDIERMAALARPHAGLITKVTVDHLDGGGTWENVAREKARLGVHLPPQGVMALHAEDPGCTLIDRSLFTAPVLTFGEGEGAAVRYSDVRLDEQGTAFTLTLPGGGVLPCRVKPVGAHQAANGAAAATVAHALGMDAGAIVQGLAAVEPLPRRFEVHRFTQGVTVIDDTFSNSVDAMLRGLETAAHLAAGRRKAAVLTGIAQLQEESERYHRLIGAKVAECGFTELVLALPDARTEAIVAGAAEAGGAVNAVLVAHRDDLPGVLRRLADPNTLLYAKASQFLWIGPQIDRFRADLPAAGFAPID